MHKEKVIGNCIVKVIAPREVTPQDVDDIADAIYHWCPWCREERGRI